MARLIYLSVSVIAVVFSVAAQNANKCSWQVKIDFYVVF
jgi:hypothetical protein